MKYEILKHKMNISVYNSANYRLHINSYKPAMWSFNKMSTQVVIFHPVKILRNTHSMPLRSGIVFTTNRNKLEISAVRQ